MTRTSGILLHISSLPGSFGIGTFGKEAYDFVDFLVKTGQTYWQILPLTTTGFGDSPYQSFSAYAGNTHFIDFERLRQCNLLEKEDYHGIIFGEKDTQIDYQRLSTLRRPILEKAVANFEKQGDHAAYEQFITANDWWLTDFSEYMAFKEYFDLKPWYQWDSAIRYYDTQAIARLRQKVQPAIHYHSVTQFLFYTQWSDLKHYANTHHINIVGDIPIYVAHDSVEMWRNSCYFKVDVNHTPTFVGGTPPDAFSDTGQYWGNPIYDWEYMKQHDYDWWLQRISHSLSLYDHLRIDHFRGFESYWAIPYGSETSADGHWEKGPGIDLFNVIQENLGEINIIAEDLGILTDKVIEMRDATGYPGMRVLQFGFSENHEDSSNLPHHYPFHSIAYVGTHDNETALGWYKSHPELQNQADLYLNRHPYESVSHAFNRSIAASNSEICIYLMQDLLEQDNTARMNTPATLSNNWQWRASSYYLSESLSSNLSKLTDIYFRQNPKITKYKN